MGIKSKNKGKKRWDTARGVTAPEKNFDFQWGKVAGKIGTAWGMDNVIREQRWLCQGNQVQGDFMRWKGLVNNKQRKRRMRQPVTYAKIGVWYLNRGALGTQFGPFYWGSHFFKYCLWLGIRCKQGFMVHSNLKRLVWLSCLWSGLSLLQNIPLGEGICFS